MISINIYEESSRLLSQRVPTENDRKREKFSFIQYLGCNERSISVL